MITGPGAIKVLEQVSEICYQSLFGHTSQFLSSPDLSPISSPSWVHDGTWHGIQSGDSFEVLRGFSGVIDLETTGLNHFARVTGAVAIGYLNGIHGAWYCSFPDPSLVRIEDSLILNWNQPFDRKFYAIRDGKDTNRHIDLMGLALAVRGKPEEWLPKYSDLTWESYTLSGMSLKNAYKEYGFGELDKSTRDDIVAGIATQDDIMGYCYEDVRATVQVGRVVLSEYLTMAPNPISLMGHVLRHGFVLPISDKWDGYVERAESWYQSEREYQSCVVSDSLYLSLIPSNPQHKSIHDNYPEKFQPRYFVGWINTLMGFKQTGRKGEKKTKPGVGNSARSLLLPLWGLMVGAVEFGVLAVFLPKYFWECLGKSFSMASPIYGLIIPLEWDGHPVLYSRKVREWRANGVKLENFSDAKKSLSTPLCKEYLKKLGSELDGPLLEPKFVSSMKACIRWQMFRARVSDLEVRDGWLIPEYSPTGTLSCRSVDKVFLLFGSPKPEMGGSELMSMIEAKPGYKIIQADLDSAELVLAGIVAAGFGGHTSEDSHPLCKANLSGTKEQGTDVHSLVATETGMPRDKAKNLVYGGFYGQGIEARTEQIRRECKVPRPEAEVLEKKFRTALIEGLASDYFEGLKLMSKHRVNSALLGRGMPLAYLKAGAREGVTSINNHNIQTLGVDWLDSLQALIMVLTSGWERKPDLILTRHDELIYHCPEGLTDQFSEVMQTAHAIIKTAICYQFGILECNPTWLRFSSVDVGDRYRKTPDSNPSTVTTQFD